MAKYIDVCDLYETAKNQALESASHRPDDDGYTGFCNFIADSTYRTGLLTPAADVAPVVHGRWVWQPGYLYMCTACKADCHVDECMNEPQYAYCPNCGAKMDLGG